jgi:uncharacterized membrane protein HdeD (DUF308 family)
MVAAVRRLALLVGGAIGVTGVVGGLAGAALGSGFARSATVSLYVVGCFLLVLGIFAGVRGPVRPRGTDEDRQPLGTLFGYGFSASGIRRATAEERADARSTTWLFLAVGVAMIVAGVLLDPKTTLV